MNTEIEKGDNHVQTKWREISRINPKNKGDKQNQPTNKGDKQNQPKNKGDKQSQPKNNGVKQNLPIIRFNKTIITIENKDWGRWDLGVQLWSTVDGQIHSV